MKEDKHTNGKQEIKFIFFSLEKQKREREKRKIEREMKQLKKMKCKYFFHDMFCRRMDRFMPFPMALV